MRPTRAFPAGGPKYACNKEPSRTGRLFCRPKQHTHWLCGISERKCIPKQKKKRPGLPTASLFPFPPSSHSPSLHRVSLVTTVRAKVGEGGVSGRLRVRVLTHMYVAFSRGRPRRLSHSFALRVAYARQLQHGVCMGECNVNVAENRRAPPVWYLYAHEPHTTSRRH